MAVVWPLLAMAGAGALHGLSPATGWMLAAACGVHARDEAQARRALRPIAFGQVASMSVLAVALLVVAALWLAATSSTATCRRRRERLGVRGTSPPIRVDARVRGASIALWSFLMASAQGTGLMLVPALVPLCTSSAAAATLPAPGSSPLTLAVAAVAVHTAAMLFVTGLLATGVCRGVRAHGCALPRAIARWVWTVALAVASAGIMTLQ